MKDIKIMTENIGYQDSSKAFKNQNKILEVLRHSVCCVGVVSVWGSLWWGCGVLACRDICTFFAHKCAVRNTKMVATLD